MLNEDLSSGADDPPGARLPRRLKEFRSAGKGGWANTPDSDWTSWRWQLQHRITTLDQLERRMSSLTREERAGTLLANSKLAMAITPYFFNLIDQSDEQCPIRLQVIPRLEE